MLWFTNKKHARINEQVGVKKIVGKWWFLKKQPKLCLKIIFNVFYTFLTIFKFLNLLLRKICFARNLQNSPYFYASVPWYWLTMKSYQTIYPYIKTEYQTISERINLLDKCAPKWGDMTRMLFLNHIHGENFKLTSDLVIYNLTLRKNCPYSYSSFLGLNARKYGPEKLLIWTLFKQCYLNENSRHHL